MVFHLEKPTDFKRDRLKSYKSLMMKLAEDVVIPGPRLRWSHGPRAISSSQGHWFHSSDDFLAIHGD